ncbi:hypothetical protein HK405_014259, partial [Cladochytrium tenue]
MVDRDSDHDVGPKPQPPLPDHPALDEARRLRAWDGFHARQAHAAAFLAAVAAGDLEAASPASSSPATTVNSGSLAQGDEPWKSDHHPRLSLPPRRRGVSASVQQIFGDTAAGGAGGGAIGWRFASRRSTTAWRNAAGSDASGCVELDSIVVVNPSGVAAATASTGSLHDPSSSPLAAGRGKKAFRDLDYEPASNKSVPIPVEVEAMIDRPARNPYATSVDLFLHRRLGSLATAAAASASASSATDASGRQSVPATAVGHRPASASTTARGAAAVESPDRSFRSLNEPWDDDHLRRTQSDDVEPSDPRKRTTTVVTTSPSAAARFQRLASTSSGGSAPGPTRPSASTSSLPARRRPPTSPTTSSTPPPSGGVLSRRSSAAAASAAATASRSSGTIMLSPRSRRAPRAAQPAAGWPVGILSVLWDRASTAATAAVASVADAAAATGGPASGWLTALGPTTPSATAARTASTTPAGGGRSRHSAAAADAFSGTPRPSLVSTFRRTAARQDHEDYSDEQLAQPLSEASSSEESDTQKNLIVSGKLLKSSRRSSRQISAYKERLVDSRVVFCTES